MRRRAAWSISFDLQGVKVTEQVSVEGASGQLSGGDWAMGVVSFFLTPIVPLILSIYNFAKARRPQALLYLGVIGVQVALVALSVGLT